MSELKRCPFCKKPMDTSYSLKHDDKSIVICWQCGAECELSEWDKRPLEDALQKQVDELRLYINKIENDYINASHNKAEYKIELDTLRQEKQTKDAVIASLTADYIEENELLRQEKQDLIENAEGLYKAIIHARIMLAGIDVERDKKYAAEINDSIKYHCNLMKEIKEQKKEFGIQKKLLQGRLFFQNNFIKYEKECNK